MPLLARMSMKQIRSCTLVLCLLIPWGLVACGSPAPRPNATLEIFQDDFSQDLRLWEVFAESGAMVQITDGHLSISLTQPTAVTFSMAAINVTDFDLTVNTRFVSGNLTNTYGVIFRYLDEHNFYRFDVSGDGLWGFSRRQNDQWISILDLAASSAIHDGLAAANVLRVVARGDTFVFYANGNELGHTSDTHLALGRVGLFVSTFDASTAQVDFDDIKIVKP